MCQALNFSASDRSSHETLQLPNYCCLEKGMGPHTQLVRDRQHLNRGSQNPGPVLGPISSNIQPDSIC